MEYIGYGLIILVGISLGLIGSGGSILTVPILVYVIGVDPIIATAYSLCIVGSTALVGGIRNAKQGNVNFRTAAIFGLSSIFVIFFTRSYLVPMIPDPIMKHGDIIIAKGKVIMLFFSTIMIISSIKMIFSSKPNTPIDEVKKLDFTKIILNGILVGLISGLVGAGGGFLIIPALVLLFSMPMKEAIGTSLIIIATNSLIGFSGDLIHGTPIDWRILGISTGFAIVGIFIGNALAKKIDGNRLKLAFGWFVFLMAIFILIKEFLS